MRFTRSSGVLLHITSLPGDEGIGDFGTAAFRFADYLSVSRQSLWQILPLTPPGFGDSPYQCYSAFAGNTRMISLEQLVGDGLLSPGDLEDRPSFNEDRVQFAEVAAYKDPLLAKAFHNFKQSSRAEQRHDFESFCRYAKNWLDDYALFRALMDVYRGAAWNTWQKDLAFRHEEALVAARKELREAVEAQKFSQYLFFKQWLRLKTYCNERGIRIVGDMPIFVAHNSADVWAHPELFKLDADGRPTVVAGVPPDYFSEDGQLWGNPIYNWERMEATGFTWWVNRMRATLDTVDMVRVDHFRGFVAAWEIPAREPTARHGKWVPVPGRALFSALDEAFDELPVLAEDLGLITPDVEALRDELGLTGMKVLQFGLGGNASNTHLPHHYTRNSVVYTGTHDNDTVVGWYEERLKGKEEYAARELTFCRRYLGAGGDDIHWDFNRAALSSVADLAILQLQDLLGLDTGARMNLPATEEGNWNWRVRAALLTREVSDRLREMTEIYGRVR